VRLRFAVATDRGQQRENNEDAALTDPALQVFAIADGMGGHAGGEVASQLALESVISVVQQHADVPSTRHEKILLRDAVTSANDAVAHEARERALHGMGTTLTVVRFRERTAIISHVGDTRAYLVRPGRLQQLTRDQTVVELLIRIGLVRREDAHLHPDRHLLTQALGAQEGVKPDVLHVRVPKTARVLLSSDGLHDVVPEAQILELARIGDLNHAVSELIDAANACGGPDNITAVLIEL
jgi:protein phosphatase